MESPHDTRLISICEPVGESVPSGKLTVCYGKSPCFMPKSTIVMAIFKSKLLVYQNPPRFVVNSMVILPTIWFFYGK